MKKVKNFLCGGERKEFPEWLTIIYIVLYFTCLFIQPMISHQAKPELLPAARDWMTNLNAFVSALQILLMGLILVRSKKGFSIITALFGISLVCMGLNYFRFHMIRTMSGVAIALVNYSCMVVFYSYIVRSEKDEEQLTLLAHTDSVTGLPNRRELSRRMKLLIYPQDGEYKKFSVVFIDLDNFKRVNDTVGHEGGDLMMSEVVRRWQTLVVEGDLLSRIGGDEFALLTTNCPSEQELYEYLETFQEVLKEPIVIEEESFVITASFGIANFPANSQMQEELIQFADMAMYTAKKEGKDRIKFFSASMQEE